MAISKLRKNNISTITGQDGSKKNHRYPDRYIAGRNVECRSCEGIDSVENIHNLLCDCPALPDKRNFFLGSFYFDNLRELRSIKLESLLRFIKTIKWLF